MFHCMQVNPNMATTRGIDSFGVKGLCGAERVGGCNVRLVADKRAGVGTLLPPRVGFHAAQLGRKG